MDSIVPRTCLEQDDNEDGRRYRFWELGKSSETISETFFQSELPGFHF